MNDDPSEDARVRLVAALGWSERPARLDEALTHPSYANERRRRGTPWIDNQRLEFLGDSVLSLCVSERLMEEYPHASEGELSRMRAALVKGESLAAFGRELDLGDALRVGRGAHGTGDRKQANVLADAVEALVAAAYLHGGLPAARELAQRIVVAGRTRAGADLAQRDPKSELQETVQRDCKQAPRYRLEAAEGPDHDRWFHVTVLLGDEVIARGRGRSKKLAEQAAAQAALAGYAARVKEEEGSP